VKIAVNTRWLLPDKLEGFGWYTYHVLNRLADLMPETSFYFISDRKTKIKLVEKLNAEYFYINPPARHPYLWYFWNEISVPLALRKIKPDLYFSPDGFLPSKLKIPTITTIHDLNFEEADSFLDKNVQRYYKKHIRKAATVASHILTVSNFSKRELITRYGIDKNKITALYNGPQETFTDHHNRQVTTQQRIAGAHPYFLFVGAQNPRKNLHRIFKAFDAWVTKHNGKQHLVLVGERMLWNEEIQQTWKNMQHKDRVHFTGRLDSRHLNDAYSAATALLFPSLHEGFGMPIIEAFASGCPVITSLSTAMPEVAGDAALLVDPTSTDEIITAMEKLATDDALGKELRKKGFERAKLFSWDSVALEISEIIKKLASA
jgi:glycosyltransferase involved in cell wall biosynthesis